MESIKHTSTHTRARVHAEANINAMEKHQNQCLGKIRITEEEQLQILVTHFRKSFKNNIPGVIHLVDDDEISNYICPYCSHDCDLCHTLKNDHVRDCVYDTVIIGIGRHLGSKTCYISETELKKLNSITERYRVIEKLEDKDNRHREMDDLIITVENENSTLYENENSQYSHQLSKYISQIPALELRNKFDLLIGAVLEKHHLIYDEHDMHNIEQHRFHELCKHCYDARSH